MKPADLKRLLKLLRSQGVVSYKCEGLELLLDPSHKMTPEIVTKHLPGQLASELNKAAPGFFGMTEEQVLMHSSGGAES